MNHRIATFALALLAAGCGSDVSPKSSPNGSTPNSDDADGGAPEAICPPALVDQEGECVAPAETVNAAVGLDFGGEEGFASTCVYEVLDPELYRNSQLSPVGLVLTSGECRVFDNNAEFTSREERGLAEVELEGGFSITRVDDRVQLVPDDFRPACVVAPESLPSGFLEYGASYTFTSSGTTGSPFEYEVTVPGAPSFELDRLVPGEDYVFDYRPFGADRVTIYIGFLKGDYHVTCNDDDSGSLTIPASVTEYLEPDTLAFDVFATNETRDVVDGTLYGVFGTSRIFTDIEVVAAE